MDDDDRSDDRRLARPETEKGVETEARLEWDAKQGHALKFEISELFISWEFNK